MYSLGLSVNRFPQLYWFNNLDDDYALDTESSQAYIFHMSDADKFAILKANIQQMETMLTALEKLYEFAKTAEQKKSLREAVNLGKQQLAELKKRVVN